MPIGANILGYSCFRTNTTERWFCKAFRCHRLLPNPMLVVIFSGQNPHVSSLPKIIDGIDFVRGDAENDKNRELN